MKKREYGYDLKELNQLADALLAGAGTMQALPLLTPQGRTPIALTNTATGFVGIGLTGMAKNVAFGMLNTKKWYKKKRKRG